MIKILSPTTKIYHVKSREHIIDQSYHPTYAYVCGIKCELLSVDLSKAVSTPATNILTNFIIERPLFKFYKNHSHDPIPLYTLSKVSFELLSGTFEYIPLINKSLDIEQGFNSFFNQEFMYKVRRSWIDLGYQTHDGKFQPMTP